MKWTIALLVTVILLCLWTLARVDRVERAVQPQARTIVAAIR